jgi:hypothetical protein
MPPVVASAASTRKRRRAPSTFSAWKVPLPVDGREASGHPAGGVPLHGKVSGFLCRRAATCQCHRSDIDERCKVAGRAYGCFICVTPLRNEFAGVQDYGGTCDVVCV